MATGVLIVFVSLASSSHAGDTFTSLLHTHRAIEAEGDIADHIFRYIETEESRLSQLKQ